MSTYTVALACIHTCTLERDQNARSTSDGWESSPDWQANLTDQPCYFWQTTGREDVTDKDTIVGVGQPKMMVPLGTDVTDQDRVSAAGITYQGSTLIVGPLEVRTVIAKADHLELVLAQIGG